MAKLLLAIAFFVNRLWECEGGYPTLSTVRIGGLVMQNIEAYSDGEVRVHPDMRFTCNGTITKWIILTEGSADYISQGPQLQIWDRTNGGPVYTLANSSSNLATPQNLSFRNGSVLGLYQPAYQPAGLHFSLLYVHGRSRSYIYPSGGGAGTINTTTAQKLWEYPLVGMVTDPLGCFTGGLSIEDVWYTLIARRLLSNPTCARCTLLVGGLDVSCDFSQCSSITKFYIGAVFTPTFIRDTVLQLHVSYWNGTSNVNLVINATPNISTFVFEFLPLHALPANSFAFKLRLTDGNDQNVVTFATLINSQRPLIAVQSTDNCCSSRPELLQNRIFFQTAYRSMQTAYPYDLSKCQHCFLPNITFTSMGSVVSWMFTAKRSNINHQNTSYPHFELWRKASDNTGYTLLNSTAGMVPVKAGPPNVYKYSLKTPWSFQAGDVLGINLPPPDAPQLRLIFVMHVDNLTYCQFDNSTLCSNLPIVPLVTPEVLPTDNSAVAMMLTSLANHDISITSSDTIVPTSVSSLVILNTPTNTASTGVLSLSSSNSLPLPLAGSLPLSTVMPSSSDAISFMSSPSIEMSNSSMSTFNIESSALSSTSSTPVIYSTSSTPEISSTSSTPVISSTSSISNPSTLTSSVPIPSTSSSISTSITIPLAATSSLFPTSSMSTLSSSAHSPSSNTSPIGLNSAPLIGLIVGPMLGAVLVVGLVLCATAFVVNRRKRRKNKIGRYMGPPGETLVLENVVYDAVGHAQPFQNENLHNPIYNNNFGDGLDVGKLSNPVEYAIITSHLSAPYYQFLEQNGELYWEPSSTSEQLYEQLSQYQYNQIPRSDITVLEHLGSGEFGTVSKGLWEAPNRATEVALKTLRVGAEEKDRVRFLREAAIMGQFHHPNVVHMYGVVTMGDPMMIVLELMSGGDLRQLLIDQKQRVSSDPSLPNRCLQFCCQIACGMVYLTKKAFIHRDLAARNILLCNNGDVCKIADFGMSRDLQDKDYYRSKGGKIPVKWTAPEALHYKTYSHASDVWSFGCVMYEIWSLGRKPFEEKPNEEVFQLIDSGYRLPPPPGCPRAIYGLMIQCWNPNKSLRPTFEAIFQSLSKPKDRVLHWAREDTCVHPQCSSLGVPLDCGANLYPSLQGMYLQLPA